jgi:hypothetical protein
MTARFDAEANRHATLTERLILAYLTDMDAVMEDDNLDALHDNLDALDADIGDCPHCWRAIAHRAAIHAAEARGGIGLMRESWTWRVDALGGAVENTQRRIAELLDFADQHRRQ